MLFSCPVHRLFLQSPAGPPNPACPPVGPCSSGRAASARENSTPVDPGTESHRPGSATASEMLLPATSPALSAQPASKKPPDFFQQLHCLSCISLNHKGWRKGSELKLQTSHSHRSSRGSPEQDPPGCITAPSPSPLPAVNPIACPKDAQAEVRTEVRAGGQNWHPQSTPLTEVSLTGRTYFPSFWQERWVLFPVLFPKCVWVFFFFLIFDLTRIKSLDLTEAAVRKGGI